MATSARASSFLSSALGARIVVPVARPESLDSLLVVAAAMAAGDDGHVVPVNVVPLRASSADIRAAAEVAVDAERRLRRDGVSASGLVAEAAHVADGVRSVVTSESATLVIMGWRGMADVSQAFDATVDDVAGHSSVPLLVVRPSEVPPRRVVLPLTPAHVEPGAVPGLQLATTVARRLAVLRDLGISILWAGDDCPRVPDEIVVLGDRLHNDPRRLDQAVAAMVQAGDMVVASIGLTARGLRDLTSQVSVATTDATLVVAIDPGRRHHGLGQDVADAVRTPPDRGDPGAHLVTVTIDPPPDGALTRRRVVRALEHLGQVSDVRAQWRAATGDRRLRVEVRLAASGPSEAVGAVMAALHHAPALAGATLQYGVAEVSDPLTLDRLERLGAIED